MHPLIDIYVCVWECICLKQPSASLLLSVSLEIDSCVLERGAVLIFLVNSSLPFSLVFFWGFLCVSVRQIHKQIVRWALSSVLPRFVYSDAD